MISLYDATKIYAWSVEKSKYAKGRIGYVNDNDKVDEWNK